MRNSDEWLSVTEVARRIGRSQSGVRALIREGKLVGKQHVAGGKWQVRESECDRYEAELESGVLTAAA